MGKIVFIPFSIGTGLVAGQIAKKVFDGIWRLIDEEEAPEPEHRYIPMWKLIVALAIQGAIFRIVKGLVDHGGRQGYLRLTGSWPGDEEPDQSD
jgi:hypothetical protein